MDKITSKYLDNCIYAKPSNLAKSVTVEWRRSKTVFHTTNQ